MSTLPTPRTDLEDQYRIQDGPLCVPIGFARELERECAAKDVTLAGVRSTLRVIENANCELGKRNEHLENLLHAANEKLKAQECANVVQGDEGTQYCALAESSVAALRKERDLLKEADRIANESIAVQMAVRDELSAERDALAGWKAAALESAPKIRELIADKDRYGRTLDNVGAMASQLFYELHGRKMDGPHNKTEVILLDISTACTAALNGKGNPSA